MRSGDQAVKLATSDTTDLFLLAQSALERLPVPFRQVGRSGICALQEIHQRRIGIVCPPHCGVGQQEFAQLLDQTASAGFTFAAAKPPGTG